jgi:hypothetical protein
MKTIALSAGAVLALAACATTPPAPVPQGAVQRPRSVVAPLPPSPEVATLLRRAGREDAPFYEDVQRLLGPADVARRETAGALLTYRLDGCALVLAFAMDNLNRLRLIEVAPGAVRFGDPAPGLDQCATALEARRASSPG